jgi:hypothetical protein
MKLSCDQATTICDKSQYGEVSLFERIKLSLHLFKCKKCGKYTQQNGILTKCYEAKAKHEKMKKDCLSEDEKQYLEKEIKQKRNNA